MPVRALEQEDDVAALHAAGVAWLGADAQWLDVHTHIGHHDPDGLEADPEELVEALDLAGQQAACVFPMHEPDGYAQANATVRDAAARWPDRLSWLCRVSPHQEDPGAEVARCLDAGARGLKLHPRSDSFAMDHPAIEGLVAQVAERRGVVLVHAGRGIPELGAHAARLAADHPDARIILAHAGISDLGLLADAAAALPNLLFDTSWWQPADMLMLFTTVPPGRILYASDMPYGPPKLASTIFLRGVRQAGWTPEQAREAAGPQARRALMGEDLVDLGPALGPEGLGPRVLSFERAAAYLTAAVQGTFRGGDPTEAYALARLACQRVDGEAPHAAHLEAVEALVARAQELLETRGAMDAVTAAMGALTVAGTPGVPA
ncbi:amidohydrolase family protein [Conexibacter sp. SYSU D00693]|uniref:amidohydrolase family protein n=1 Tax=Conexibacter sp. SYSU D00693 TaxID=2812560 RepID=UPI00196A92DE|nr:amidohydrolase family protein [Conexibacter sp. SYSU D00693]